MIQDNKKPKTNAEALADIAKQKGNPLMHMHTSHLDPEVLHAQVDTAPMCIVDICCGTPIWDKLPAAALRIPPLEDDI